MSELIHGMLDAQRALANLSRDVKNKVLKKAMRDGAKFLRTGVRKAAPVKTGRLRRGIRVSGIKQSRRTGALSLQVYVLTGHQTRSRRDRTAAYYAHFQENGYTAVGSRRRIGMTGRQPISGRKIAGKKFFRNTFLSQKEAAMDLMINSAVQEIEKSARDNGFR